MFPTAKEDASIIIAYKQNGKRAKCSNSRGISLPSMSSEVLANIMLSRLLKHVADLFLPVSQCGFWRGRSTMDIIFVARQLQEKCREEHHDLYMPFVDWTKALDAVNRDLLWNILRTFDCPPSFVAILQQFNTGMCAQVVTVGSLSSNLHVDVGVKQGCVLAPIIFNLFLIAITLVSDCDLLSSDCVAIDYCPNGGLFNLRRLQTKTKTSSTVISALQYTDDLAFPSLTATRLHRSLFAMTTAYFRAGLIINTTITDILRASSHDFQSIFISGKQLIISEDFIYLGLNLSFSGDIANEIHRPINLVSSALVRLRNRVFGNQNLTIHSKIAVNNSVVISTIQYGCETWVPYRRHFRLLESLLTRRLQFILGLRW